MRAGLIRVVLIGTIALRVVAAIVLIAGPWTNEPAELDGWDVDRFQAIATAPGRHWVDHEVEYPPGSVVAIETIAQDGVVETHRMLVAVSLAIDLAVAALLATLGGRRAAAVYLVLGLPLVPMGLLRFDLWAVMLAVVAAAALTRRKPAAFAVIATAGALVKVWPALLVAAAVGVRRPRAAGAAVAMMAVAGVVWLVYGGFSAAPIDQVLSLRGATGWHVESLGGTLTALLSDAVPEQQLDAFRIGELNDAAVTAGRVVTIVAIAALTVLAYRASTLRAGGGQDDDASGGDSGGETGSAEMEVVALVMLGATAALLVTAPLLSPQFLLWLTPWAALLPLRGGRPPLLLGLTVVATLTTGVVLAGYGPPGVAATTPALLLLGRNLILAALVVGAGVALWRLPATRPSPASAPADAG